MSLYFQPSGGELKPPESKKVMVTFQPVSAKLIFLFILQAFSELTFEPSSGELKPLESKMVKVTKVLIIFCLFCRPLVSLHLSHPAGS